MPAPFRNLFTKRFLSTHRGYDPGALDLAREFAAATAAPLFYSTVSRLLVELNRPLDHPQVFSKNHPPEVREKLLQKYYFPYWRGIESAIAKGSRSGRRVVHLSVHSFTPRFRGERRTTDIGLLFDPRRPLEAAFCRKWKTRISGLVIHLNKPYKGAHPSVVASMRERFQARRYVGIQIEVNQKFARADEARWRALRALLAVSLRETMHYNRGFSYLK